jgi:hypothetical protein
MISSSTRQKFLFQNHENILQFFIDKTVTSPFSTPNTSTFARIFLLSNMLLSTHTHTNLESALIVVTFFFRTIEWARRHQAEEAAAGRAETESNNDNKKQGNSSSAMNM